MWALAGQVVFDALGQVNITGLKDITETMVDGLMALGHEQNVSVGQGVCCCCLVCVSVTSQLETEHNGVMKYLYLINHCTFIHYHSLIPFGCQKNHFIHMSRTAVGKLVKLLTPP